MPKPSALKREHPALQKMKILSFFQFFLGHFCPPGSGSGSSSSNWCGSWSETLIFTPNSIIKLSKYRFGIRNPEKPIPDPGSRIRGQKGTGSRIRIRNTGSLPGFGALLKVSWIGICIRKSHRGWEQGRSGSGTSGVNDVLLSGETLYCGQTCYQPFGQVSVFLLTLRSSFLSLCVLTQRVCSSTVQTLGTGNASGTCFNYVLGPKAKIYNPPPPLIIGVPSFYYKT